MSWKTPRPHSGSSGIRQKPTSMKPHKLPTVKRGGGLRVGRVVSDARGSSNWDTQSSSPFVQEEERRVHEELIEMLTVKLANKEKEVEILRCKQNAVDREFASHDNQLRQQQEERVVSELSTMNQELQQQVQHLQIQCERFQFESETQRTDALEQRRLREKDQAQTRNENMARQQTLDNLRRERQHSVNDQYALEEKLQRVLQDQQMQNNLDVQLESKCSQLENDISESRQTCQQLHEALTSEKKQREDAEKLLRRLEEEKVALEDNLRALAKTLRGASSRALDIEKKRSDLSRVETQLTEQLTSLKKENLKLKARRGQISSQTKHLQNRVAALESANATQEQKLEDAAIELESARKCSRDCQFRTKQLQEEIVFLKNRKVPATPSVSESNSPSPDTNPESSAVHTPVQETEAGDAVPCWMKG